jgi:ABC-type bacteriocin/lantibiotic exporter with double-glycine peptidase domain
METMKSLQMEPQLKQTFGNYLSTYLNASFDSRKLSITYNTAANTCLIKQGTTTNTGHTVCRCMAGDAQH